MMIPYFDGLRFHNRGHLANCAGGPANWTTPYYCLAFVAAGSIQMKIGHKRAMTLRAPTAWWFAPGIKLTFGPEKGKTWEHIFVTFSGPRAQRMFRQRLVPRQFPPHMVVAQPERFLKMFEAFLELLNNHPQKNSFLAHELEGLWLELHQTAVSQAKADSPSAKIKELIQAIRMTPEQTWEMADEARRLHLSEVHFRHLFRRQSGLPPHQWVLHCRLARAARLLLEESVPVKKVAEESGFPDPFHFTKMFRQHYGIPPAAYRRELQSRTFGGYGKL